MTTQLTADAAYFLGVDLEQYAAITPGSMAAPLAPKAPSAPKSPAVSAPSITPKPKAETEYGLPPIPKDHVRLTHFFKNPRTMESISAGGHFNYGNGHIGSTAEYH
jgi:hypothetical protein